MEKQPVNILKLSMNDLKKFLNSFDHVFSDCDGVIWSIKPILGSGEFFKRMKQLGKTVHYVSNNSMRTRENYEASFKAANIKNGFENLTIPSVAFAEYLKTLNFNKHIYCVTCPETIRILETHGFKCKYGPDVGVDYYEDYLQYLEDDLEIGAVAFDSDFKVNIPKMYKAITYLKRPDVLFINGATDKYVSLTPDVLSLGNALFTNIIAEETNRTPVLLGKPGKLFAEFAMKRAGVTDASRVLFIGDMIEQDVALGKAAGFKTLLVLTNNTTETMLAHKTIQPDFYADNLGSIAKML